MSVVEIENSASAEKLHSSPFRLRHKLVNHQLFTLQELENLSLTLPRDMVEYNDASLTPGHCAQETPKLTISVGEAIRNIRSQNAWVVLKRVERVPAYGALLEEFLHDLFVAAGTPEQRYSDLQGFIFISSASATTPFHADAEENVLVHLRGEKLMHVFDNSDRSLLSEEALEISPSEYRNRAYEDAFEEKATVYELTPGDALHVPYLTPHWVRTKDSYTVSMAMTWKTPQILRLNKIRLMNGTLRRFGMPQKAPGIWRRWDSAKVFVHDAVMMVIGPLRKSEKIRRFLRGLVYGKRANYYYDNDDAGARH